MQKLPNWKTNCHLTHLNQTIASYSCSWWVPSANTAPVTNYAHRNSTQCLFSSTKWEKTLHFQTISFFAAEFTQFSHGVIVAEICQSLKMLSVLCHIFPCINMTQGRTIGKSVEFGLFSKAKISHNILQENSSV